MSYESVSENLNRVFNKYGWISPYWQLQQVIWGIRLKWASIQSIKKQAIPN
jgi:hypothetical protein